MNERFEALCKQKEEEEKEEKEVEFDEEEMIVEKEKPSQNHGLHALSESEEESDLSTDVETEKKKTESSEKPVIQPDSAAAAPSTTLSALKMTNPRGYSSQQKEETVHTSKEGASLLTLFSRAKARPHPAPSASIDSSNPSSPLNELSEKNVLNTLNPSNSSIPSNSLNELNELNSFHLSDGAKPSDPQEAEPSSEVSSPSIDENDYKEGEQPTAEDYARYRAMMKDSSWFKCLN